MSNNTSNDEKKEILEEELVNDENVSEITGGESENNSRGKENDNKSSSQVGFPPFPPKGVGFPPFPPKGVGFPPSEPRK